MEEKVTCQSWLGYEFDSRIPTLDAASYRVFALKNPSTHKKAQDDVTSLLKTEQECQVLDDNKGLQILIDNTSGKQFQVSQYI